MEDRVRKIKEGVVKASFFSLRNIDWSGDVMEATNSLIDLEDWDKHKNQYLEQHINGYHPDTTTEERLIFENERLDKYEASLDTYEHELRSMAMKYRKMLENYTEPVSKEVVGDDTKPSVSAIALKYYYDNLPLDRSNATRIAKSYGHGSGQYLYQTYTFYCSRQNRVAIGDLSERKIKARIELLEEAIEITDNKDKVKLEIELIENSRKEYR